MNIGKNSCMQRVNKLAKIRFKGYDISLERKTIGDITTSFSGGTPKSSNKSYYEGNIPFIRSGEVKSKQTELFISDEALNNSSAKLVEKGDILYALYGATSGEVAINQINGAINQAILAIKPKPGYSSEFMMNYLKKEKDNILEKYLQGGQGNLSAAIVKSIELSLPNLAEQSAIGSLFRTLDNLLSSYKDNLANYQSLKATMLSKMFPKAGQNVPEIRLDGFEGEWEIKRADEIFKSVSEKNKAFLPVLSASQIDGMVLRNEIGINIKYDEATLNNYKVVKPGQFVIHLRSFQGGFALSKLEGITSPAYTIIDFIDKENNLSDFWNSILTSRDFIKRLEAVTYGIRDGKSISFKDFSSLKFANPELEEQQDIGSYFSNLDNLINSHQEKISQLETLKKKLLQDMFI